MGYTHYFKLVSSIDENELKIKHGALVVDLKRLFQYLPEHSDSARAYYNDSPLYIYDGEGETRISNPDNLFVDDGGVADSILFNGDASLDLDHEPFYFGFASDGNNVSFCKTNRKPYDFLVCATLLLIHRYFSDYVSVSSDGDKDDWLPVVRWVANVLNTEISVPDEIAKNIHIKPSDDYVPPDIYLRQPVNLGALCTEQQSHYF